MKKAGSFIEHILTDWKLIKQTLRTYVYIVCKYAI